MSSVLQKTCPSAVLQWKDKAEYWSRQTKVPTALILAFIDQESGGNTKATRTEIEYCKNLLNTVAGSNKINEISKTTKLQPQDIVTSYGLMQPLFMLAYGYGARSIADLYDPSTNIRYCAAHINVLHEQIARSDKHGWTSDKHIRKVAGKYNGAGEESKYAQDIVTLYHKYADYLSKGV